MRVVAFLLNGQYHIHRVGCDCGEALPPDGRSSPFEVTCYEDVARHCYARFLGTCMDIGEALDCLTFASCTHGLTYAAVQAGRCE